MQKKSCQLDVSPTERDENYVDHFVITPDLHLLCSCSGEVYRLVVTSRIKVILYDFWTLQRKTYVF